MSEYLKQATDFLTKNNATISITFTGKAINKEWKETKPRNTYDVTIKTARGEMTFTFLDSLHNTEISERRMPSYAGIERIKYERKFIEEKNAAKPNAYDVLACLTKYDPGLFEEFCSEYEHDEDSRTAERTYHAVMREYKQLERIFTPEQMEELREIQ